MESNIPIMKPRNPIQADVRWTRGFSSAADALSPILCRSEVKAKVKKNRAEKDKATAINTGVDGAGGDSSNAGAL